MAAASQLTQGLDSDDDIEMVANEEREKRIEKNDNTYDAPTFDYPQNEEQYSNAESKILEYFTDSDCYKIIRTLDILHTTLRMAITSKKNIKTIAFVQSLLEKKSLHNYLLSIEDKNTPLIDVLFKPSSSSSSSSSSAAASSAAASSSDITEGEGILIWGESNDNRLVLCQLVNPYSRDKLPKSKKKKAQLTDGANSWLQQKQITVKSYLSGETSYPLIFDILTNPTSNTFDITQGEFKIDNNEQSKTSYIVWSNNSVFGLQDLDDDYDITKQVSYLPFFQSYSRYLKHGAYKQFGELSTQMSYCDEQEESSITPIIKGDGEDDDTEMYCALCGKELDSNKSGEYTYDVDHVWNLILNGVLNVLDSPSGYFNTHDACNRSFKSDKVFTPNVGLWKKIYEKSKNYSEGKEKRKDYVWPGSIYGMEGIEGAVKPFGGWRVFTIGYINEEFRTRDYENAGISIDEDNILESEGLNHSGIQKSKKWKGNERKFNELDLQLKFLKRTLLIANELDGNIEKLDRQIVNDLVSSFESEIILLQQGAESMQILQAIQNNNKQRIPPKIQARLDNKPVKIDPLRWRKILVADYLKESKNTSRMGKPSSVLIDYTPTDDKELSTTILEKIRNLNTHADWKIFKQQTEELNGIMNDIIKGVVNLDEVASSQLRNARGVLSGLISNLNTPGAGAPPEKWKKRIGILQHLNRKVDEIITTKTKLSLPDSTDFFATTASGSPLGRRNMSSSSTPSQYTPGQRAIRAAAATPAVRRKVQVVKKPSIGTNVFGSSFLAEPAPAPAAAAASLQPPQAKSGPAPMDIDEIPRQSSKRRLDGLQLNEDAQAEAENKRKNKKRKKGRKKKGKKGGTKRKRRKKRKTRMGKKEKGKNKTRRKNKKTRRK